MNIVTPAPDPGLDPVVFTLSSPGARSVWLAFFFNQWTSGQDSGSFARHEPVHGDHLMVRELVRLTQAKPGQWSCEIKLSPGRHEYLFLVDGAWVMDPDAAEVCQDLNGGFNCARLVQPSAVVAKVAASTPVPLPRTRTTPLSRAI